MADQEWPPEGMTWAPAAPWQNTWQCGPGVHAFIVDDLELGPRVAIPWSSGRRGCVTELTSPDTLRRLAPNPRPHYPQRPTEQLGLFA